MPSSKLVDTRTPRTLAFSMDQKSIERFKRKLQVRHRELQSGVAQTEQNLRGAQNDYGKDEGDRANTSLSREIDLAARGASGVFQSHAIDLFISRQRWCWPIRSNSRFGVIVWHT